MLVTHLQDANGFTAGFPPSVNATYSISRRNTAMGLNLYFGFMGVENFMLYQEMLAGHLHRIVFIVQHA